MTIEQQCTVSKVLQDWENKVGLDHKLSLSEATMLADKVGEAFRRCEPLEHTLKNFGTQTSFPHIFFVGGRSFDVSYPKQKSEMSLFEKLKLRLMLMRLRLSQFVFPDSLRLQNTRDFM